MKTILCFGDSNTWGWSPHDKSRYAPEKRWPGVLRSVMGKSYFVIEEGLPGRTTVRDDPMDGYKNGKDYLIPCLYTHAPIDLVILMLGSNELKAYFSLSARDIALGAGELVTIIQQCQHGPDNTSPKVLFVAPPTINPPSGSELETLFAGGGEKSKHFGQYFQEIAIEKKCHFMDARPFILPSPVDGVHLEIAEHHKLGIALALKILEILV